MTEKSLPEYLLSPVSVKRWAGDEAGVYLFKKKNAVLGLGLGLGLRLGLGLGTLTLTLTPKQLSLKKKKKKINSDPGPGPGFDPDPAFYCHPTLTQPVPQTPCL